MFVYAILIVAWTTLFTSPAEARKMKSKKKEKVPICHRPPGNPGNFRTIQVARQSVSAHLARGDLEGPCNDSCNILCDDNNACTNDYQVDCEENGCTPSVDRPPVVCEEFGWVCDATQGGCINPCDDGIACTQDKVNFDGSCSNDSLCEFCLVCDATLGECINPCDDGIACTENCFNGFECFYEPRDEKCPADEKCFEEKGCLPFCDGLDQYDGNGHLYYYEPLFSTWLNARDLAPGRLPKCCGDTPAHLVTITSVDENTFVTNILQKNFVSSSWIGLSDLIPYDEFEWITGEPVDFTAWGPGQPRFNVGRGELNCTQISSPGGTWSTLPCNAFSFPIFEYDCI